MRNWIWLVLALIVGLLITAALRAEDDVALPFDRAARVERIDVEIRQVALEQQRLVDERRELIRERACVAKAQTRQAMKLCSKR